MIECSFDIGDFSQGSLNTSDGRESADLRAVRTDFCEIPRGLQTFSVTPHVIRKIWKHEEQTYEYVENSASLCYAWFFTEKKAFIGRTNVLGTTVDFLQHLGARYVRFTVSMTTVNLYPDASLDPKESYYFLQNISTDGTAVEWSLDENNKLIHENLSIAPEKTFTKPYPKALWRIDYLSPNMPYHRLFPMQQTIHTTPVKQREYITIHDMRTEQNNFDNNGLAVLDPISCTVTEIFNAGWTVTLDHPVDSDEKWKYLVEFNILKVLGQLFVIRKVEHSWTGNSGKVTVYAEHIFYYFNDVWLFKGTDLYADSGYWLVKKILDSCRTGWVAGNIIYNFNFFSDMTSENIGVDMGQIALYKWSPLTNATTPVDMLLGNDGFTANFGGELYRNNFYFSINNRMEYARDNAFEIRVGLNLTGITRTVDTSELCTDFTAYDKFGASSSWYWEKQKSIPHHIVRSQEFSFGENYTETNFTLLGNEAGKYFSQHGKPQIAYSISIEDIRNNPDYTEFSNHMQYNVGDRGKIFDERLNINIDAFVSETVKDGITGKTLEVRFRNQTEFLRNGNNYDISFEETPPPSPPDIPEKNPDEDDKGKEEEENP